MTAPSDSALNAVFEIKNVGMGDCAVEIRTVPSSNPAAVDLRVYRQSNLQRLDRSLAPVDLPARLVVIPPGETRLTEYRLTDEFPDLERLLRDDSALLVWGFAPILAGGQCAPADFGLIRLQRRQRK
jgi:hypothetical protein